MLNTLLLLQVTIITYIAAGYLLCKTGIMTMETQKSLSTLIVEVILPVNVFVSSLESLSFEMIGSFLLTFLLAVSIELVLLFLTKRNIRGFGEEEHRVARYGLLVSNGGLIGAPIMGELLGATGAVICNVFMIPTRIVTYSAGELIFGREQKKSIVKLILKNKVIVAMGLALTMEALHIAIPQPCLIALKNMGSCLSPLAILTIGSMLADCRISERGLLCKIAVVSLFRLIFIPVAALGFCYLFSIDYTNTLVLVLLLGMPIGTTVAMHAKKYQGDFSLASALVLVTTLCSTFTLIFLAGMIEFVFRKF